MCYVLAMSRASSHALKHPPVTAPSTPAGALPAFPELSVAIKGERRRGRGAQSNTSGRYEAEARWWTYDEIESSSEAFSPPPLHALLRRLITSGTTGDVIDISV